MRLHLVPLALALGCGPVIRKGVVVADGDTQQALSQKTSGLYKPSEWAAEGVVARPRPVTLVFNHVPEQLTAMVEDPSTCRESVIASAPSPAAPTGFLVGALKSCNLSGGELYLKGEHVPLSAALKRGGLDLSLVLTDDGFLPKDLETGGAVEVRKGVVPLHNGWFAKKGRWEQADPVRLPGPTPPRLPKLNVGPAQLKLKPLGQRLDSNNGCQFKFKQDTKTTLESLVELPLPESIKTPLKQVLQLEGRVAGKDKPALDALAAKAKTADLVAEATPQVGLALGLGLVASQVDLSLFPSKKSNGKGALRVRPAFRLGRTIHSAQPNCGDSRTGYVGAQFSAADMVSSYAPGLGMAAEAFGLTEVGFEFKCEYSPLAPMVKPLVVWVGPLPVVLVPRMRTRFVTEGTLSSAEVCMGPVDGVEIAPEYSQGLRKKTASMDVSFAETEPAVFHQLVVTGELSVGADASFLVGIYDLAGPQVTGGVEVSVTGGGFGVPAKLHKTAYLKPGFGAGRLLWWTGWGTDWPDKPRSGSDKTAEEDIKVRRTPPTHD